MVGRKATFKNNELSKIYLRDEHTRFVDTEWVTGMITASHNTQAERATWLHKRDFLLGVEGKESENLSRLKSAVDDFHIVTS